MRKEIRTDGEGITKEVLVLDDLNDFLKDNWKPIFLAPIKNICVKCVVCKPHAARIEKDKRIGNKL